LPDCILVIAASASAMTAAVSDPLKLTGDSYPSVERQSWRAIYKAYAGSVPICQLVGCNQAPRLRAIQNSVRPFRPELNSCRRPINLAGAACRSLRNQNCRPYLDSSCRQFPSCPTEIRRLRSMGRNRDGDRLYLPPLQVHRFLDRGDQFSQFLFCRDRSKRGAIFCRTASLLRSRVREVWLRRPFCHNLPPLPPWSLGQRSTRCFRIHFGCLIGHPEYL